MAQQTFDDAVIQKLDAILSVMQDLLIIECAKAGFTKGTARSILRVDNTRIGRTWKYAKAVRDDATGD
jgi:hypothetical protein